MNKSAVKIGPCTVDFQTMSLLRGEQSCKLSIKVFELLKLFLSADDHIVSREQAINEIWLGNEGVGKRGYTNAIWTLRKSFKELGLEDQDIFLTLPKVGYQLLLEVEKVHPQSNQIENNTRKNIFYASIAASITVVFLFTAWQFSQVQQPLVVADSTSPISRAHLSSPVNITNYEGIEEYPTISNNGQYVAFQWNRENLNGGIYIKDLKNDGTPINLITMGDQIESSPAWSSNDQAIAYIRSTLQGTCEVRVRELLTNNDVFIDDSCLYRPFNRVVSWANGDTQKIIYSKHQGAAVSLFSFDLTNKENKQLTFAKSGEIDFSPLWSADNKSVLFIRQQPSTKFQVILQDENQKQHIIIDDKLSIIDLAWDRETNDIYVNYSEQGKFKIIKKSLLSGNETLLIDRGLPSTISFDKQNKKLIYADHISKEYIALIDYNSGKINRRISSSSRDMYGRFNHQDGNILFLSNRSGSWSVWQNDKLNSINISKNHTNATVPALSPNGKFMAVTFSEPGKKARELYLVDLQSKEFKLLDTKGIITDNLSWSNDNKALYFYSRSNSSSGIFKLTIETGNVEQLTFSGEHYAIEGKNGLLYTSVVNKKGIWEINLAEKSSRLITSDLAEYDYAAFFIDNGKLYYLNRAADADQVIQLDPELNRKTVQSFPSDSIRKFFGISRGDGDSFIATLKVSNEADLASIALKN